MTAPVLEIEGTWEEILAQSAKISGHRVRITIFADEESQPSPEDSFRQAWQEIKPGKVHPIAQLSEGIDTE